MMNSTPHALSWPGLTSSLARKYLPKSVSTSKGHMRQLRQNIRSMEPKLAPNRVKMTADMLHQKETTA